MVFFCFFSCHLPERTKRKGERWHRIVKFNNSVSPPSSYVCLCWPFDGGAELPWCHLLHAHRHRHLERWICRRSMRCFVFITLTRRHTGRQRTQNSLDRKVKRRTFSIFFYLVSYVPHSTQHDSSFFSFSFSLLCLFLCDDAMEQSIIIVMILWSGFVGFLHIIRPEPA